MGNEKKFLGITQKNLFRYSVKHKIAGLNFQRERIFNANHRENFGKGLSPVHDVDYYVIILRRMYREIEKIARTDSRAANLKGKYRKLVENIGIRDHFEHGVDFEKLPSSEPMNTPNAKIGSGVKIATSLFGNNIISGSFTWDLKKDHESFLELVEKFVELYPFNN